MASGDPMFIILSDEFDVQAASQMDVVFRNTHPLLSADDTTDELAIFRTVLSKKYDGGGLTVTAWYLMASATTGNLRLDLSIERIGSSLDIDSSSFATAQTSNITSLPGTAGILGSTTFTFTDGAAMDSWAAGEPGRVKIERKPSDTTNDTASGDAQIWAIYGIET